MISVCNYLTNACLFLCTGTAVAFFHLDGNFPFVIHGLKNISKGLRNELPQIIIIRILILSGPCHLFGLSFELFSKYHLEKSWRMLEIGLLKVLS